MDSPTLMCQSRKRRQEIFESVSLNGLDYLEVDQEHATLTVYLMNKANAALAAQLRKGNAKRSIVFSGGRRVPGSALVIERLEFPQIPDPDVDDRLVITLKEMGDFSIYTLSLVELDAGGRPTTEPLQGVDPRYYQVQFSFKEACPTSLDCKIASPCTPDKLDQPSINYLAKDYSSFRQLILDRLAHIMPDWHERHIPDLGVALTEILAYVGDYLSYYQDAVATEAYLNTARKRISVRRHVRLVDYFLHEGCNARTWLFLKTESYLSINPDDIYFITRHPALLAEEGRIITREELKKLPSMPYQVFEPLVTQPVAKLLILDDLKDPKSLLLKLQKPANALALYLVEQFSEEARAFLNSYDGAQSPSSELQTAILEELNLIMQRTSLYAQNRFDHVSLTAETMALISQQPQGQDLVRLNRWLLEEAFANEINGSQRRFLHLYPAHNTIYFYTWNDSECCLPKGATSATLWDVGFANLAQEPMASRQNRALRLHVGDVLLFEEILGAKTGDPADADLSHRHFVCLTRVRYLVDPLNQEPVVDIEWDLQDALPFSMCISTIGPSPQCELLENVSVARGNILLADHGESMIEALGRVELDSETLTCVREGRPEDAILTPKPFLPKVLNGPMTFSAAIAGSATAAALLQQDVRSVQPQIKLQADIVTPAGAVETNQWLPMPDLLASSQVGNHFVVEMDETGIAHLRFGDGHLGCKPRVGESFTAYYRIGNGPAGNVGAEAIAHVISRGSHYSGVSVWPRNPSPAAGGTAAESTAEAKWLAPTAFRSRLVRAITPEDYAELAQDRFVQIQRASGTLRWTGSWYEVLLAIDPLGDLDGDEELNEKICTDLQPFRRMGQDLKVARGSYVPLDIEMTICVRPGHLRGHVKAELLKVFSRAVLPDGRLGFFHPDNFTFGQAVRKSNLIAAAQAVQGVANVEVSRFQRLFEVNTEASKTEVIPISSLEIARLDNDPSFPEYGRLSFIIGGGR